MPALAITEWKRRPELVVVLDLPFPISTNRLWRPAAGRMVKTARYRTWRRAAGNEINRQRPGRIEGAFHCRITLELKLGRKIDGDNGVKCVLDALQENGVIDNDCLATETTVEWSKTVTGAHVVLTAVQA